MNILRLWQRALALALIVLSPSLHAADAPALQVVRQATESLQALIRQHRAEYVADQSRFHADVDSAVSPSFDLPYIARAVLGRSWRAASAEQRARFQDAFKTSLVRTYADALLEYNESVRVDWLSALGDESATTVKARLLRPGAEPITVEFRLHVAGDGRWKVYDIAVEAISLLTNFRTQVNAEVQRGSLDAMIQRLESGAGAAS